jgi:hypothetical protein
MLARRVVIAGIATAERAASMGRKRSGSASLPMDQTIACLPASAGIVKSTDGATPTMAVRKRSRSRLH